MVRNRKTYRSEGAPVKLVRVVLSAAASVQGRITERQLPMAEKCFPGICRLYEQMPEKPLTFLQLLWAYEGRRAAAAPRARRAARRRRA